jgi:hypothetical protein
MINTTVRVPTLHKTVGPVSDLVSLDDQFISQERSMRPLDRHEPKLLSLNLPEDAKSPILSSTHTVI